MRGLVGRWDNVDQKKTTKGIIYCCFIGSEILPDRDPFLLLGSGSSSRDVRVRSGKICFKEKVVADQDHFDTDPDPDPDFHFCTNMDPDSTFHFDTDPDPII
jgi:hypothetical protein